MPATSNAGGFRMYAFTKPKSDRGKENIKQVNPALAAAGRTLPPMPRKYEQKFRRMK